MGKESKNPRYIFGDKKGFYKIEHSGLYDFKKILNGLKAKFNELDYFLIGKEHTETVKPGGKDMKYVWVSTREVTEYIKFQIDITIIVYRQIDVIVDGKKMQKGDFIFQFKASMEKNYKKSFKDTKFGEIQRHVYEKTIVQEKLDNSEDLLEEEAKDLIKIVKENIY